MEYNKKVQSGITKQYDYGEITVFPNGHKLYSGGSTAQGYVFKSSEIYEKDLNDICYVAESDIEDYEHDSADGTPAEDLILSGYTHQDFLDMCNGREEIAKEIFDTVDWQHPETVIQENFTDGELYVCEHCAKWFWCYGLNKCPFCNTKRKDKKICVDKFL